MQQLNQLEQNITVSLAAEPSNWPPRYINYSNYQPQNYRLNITKLERASVVDPETRMTTGLPKGAVQHKRDFSKTCRAGILG